MYGLILSFCFCGMPPAPEKQMIGNEATRLLVQSIPHEPTEERSLSSKQVLGALTSMVLASVISFGVGYPIGHFYGTPSCQC